MVNAAVPHRLNKHVDGVKKSRHNSAPSTQVEGPEASSTPGCDAVGAVESLRE